MTLFHSNIPMSDTNHSFILLDDTHDLYPPPLDSHTMDPSSSSPSPLIMFGLLLLEKVFDLLVIHIMFIIFEVIIICLFHIPLLFSPCPPLLFQTMFMRHLAPWMTTIHD